MENPGILKWRRWSVVRRAQIAAACAGFVVTAAVDWLFRIGTTGENMISLSLGIAHVWIVWPARKVCTIFGWPWPLDEVRIAWKSIGLAALTNSLLALCFATIVGYLIVFLRRKKNN